MRTGSPGTSSLPLHQSLALALLLFLFWVVLSGKFDALHLGAGAFCALGIAYASCRLYALDPPVGPPGRHPFAAIPWSGLLFYFPWLAGQIFVSSLQVAKIVLSPRMDVRPKVFRFTHPLPTGMARATLANSITLTPGTVTIGVEGDDYVVHALVEEYARSLETSEPTSMKSRVSAVFDRESR